MTSRAVKLKEHSGKPEEIYELVTEAKPEASPGHVVVRMTVMPVNPKDLQNGAGGMWLTLDLKDIYVGAEGTGVVEEVIFHLTYSPNSVQDGSISVLIFGGLKVTYQANLLGISAGRGRSDTFH
jgi:hypothetical protein